VAQTDLLAKNCSHAVQMRRAAPTMNRACDARGGGGRGVEPFSYFIFSDSLFGTYNFFLFRQFVEFV
jgi:hypothetical protein